MFAIALVHYPVYNKNRKVTASAVTLLDMHDASRIAKTYDLAATYIVTPVKNQIRIAERTLGYWTKGYGSIYNPDRAEALSTVRIVTSVEEAKGDLEGILKTPVKVVATSARQIEGANKITFRELANAQFNFLLLFGTAWGLTDEFVKSVDFLLEPVQAGRYNHLSVRAAMAIIVDRLCVTMKENA